MQEPMQETRFLAGSAPPEIILSILQACDSTRDLLALVSTCRYTLQVWQANTAPALWSVWLREKPHLRDALIAVSCTFAARQVREKAGTRY